jgi:uncharacterized membrane protein YbhN (UPF0104 family)
MHPALAGVLLMAVCGLPLAPAIFNRIVQRLARRVQLAEGETVPALDFTTLLVGLGVACVGWCILGLGVWAGLAGVMDPPALSPAIWLHCTAVTGLAYVAGFVVLFMPGGIGPREYVLLVLFAPLGPGAIIAAAVLVLRIAWTAAEVVLAGVLYVLRPSYR